MKRKCSNPTVRLAFAVFVTLLWAGVTTAPCCAAAAQVSPGDLVRAVVANEMAAANDTSTKHFFHSRKQTPKGVQTKLYVETTEALAGMVVSYNDQPLTGPQLQGEEGHLQWLINNPEQLRRKQAREKEDAERTLRIVRALPDAFLYEADGAAPSAEGLGAARDRLVRLKFRPNPAYAPPSRVEQALAGMQGYVLIDEESRRLAEINGTLFKDVTFGWGILGRLDQGGNFVVTQAKAADGTWNITRMTLHFTGKILLVKGISISSDENFTEYRPVPAGTTFAQGVEILRAERAAADRAPRAEEKSAR